MSQIIFLDIDGVIMTPRSILGGKNGQAWDTIYEATDATVINFIDRLCNKGKIQICISSTHRLKPREEVEKMIHPLGAHFHPDWSTEYLRVARGHEIDKWLKKHPEIIKYLIIDDDDDMLDEQKENFCLIEDGYNGPSYKELEKIWKHFLNTNPYLMEGENDE